MATTFVIDADDYAAIEFKVLLGEGPESSTLNYNYEMTLDSLAIGEEARVQWEYAQFQHREGGEARDAVYPLVPLVFTCRVIGLGADLATRKADMLQHASALMRAIINSNGYVKYKPDEMSGTVMDTYYRYLVASPPGPLRGLRKSWTQVRVSTLTYQDGVPAQEFVVRLMTQPIAMSDPTSPTEVLSATTLNNIGDGGSDDNTTITSATVKGDIPAQTRIIAHPLTAGADAAIGTLWIAKRTSGLSNFVSTYPTSAALAPTGVWSTVGDAARINNAYYRCTPAVNDTVYARRYTISNWDDHQGRAAVLIVARCNSVGVGDFDVYYRWSIANVVTEGEMENMSRPIGWEARLLGEIDLPDTKMSAQEDLDLYLDICVIRRDGVGTFDLDAVKLLYTDEAAIQVDMPAGVGADTTHNFLLENHLDEEVAHCVVAATDKLAYLCNPKGDFITLESDSDNRLDVCWNRYAVDSYEDEFDDYGNRWMKLADFEDDESWVGGSRTTQRIEGSYAWQIPDATWAGYVPDQSINLVDWADDDYLSFSAYGDVGVEIQLYLRNSSADYYSVTHALAHTGWNHIEKKLSTLGSAGSPNWASISDIYFYANGGQVIVDDLRVSKVDPSDATRANDTGDEWSFLTYAGLATRANWHVYELDGDEKWLGCADLHHPGGWVSNYLAIHQTQYGYNVRMKAKVKLIGDTTGQYSIGEGQAKAGLVAGYNAASQAHWAFWVTKYAVTENMLYYNARLRKSGVTHGSAKVSFLYGTGDVECYMGLLIAESRLKCYISETESALWSTSSLIIDIADPGAATGGLCGLWFTPLQNNEVDWNARFTDVEIVPVKDVHIPADQIQLSAVSWFRTVYPFHEAAT